MIGASGFVGRHACAAFRAAGWRVTAVGRTPPGELTEGAAFTALDLATGDGRHSLAGLLGRLRPDAVVNAAGAVWTSDDAEIRRSNVTLVRHLVAGVSAAGRAAGRPGVPYRPRVLHLGSSLEYGPVPAGRPLTEDTPARPDTAYGRAKLLGTRIVTAACRDGAIDGVALRVFNVVGPDMPRESLLGGIAARLAAHDAAHGTLRLSFGRLGGRRDYVDVRDVAEAIVAAAAARPADLDAAGRVLNIGTGRAVDMREVVHRLIALSGVPAEVETGQDRAATARSSEAAWQQADIGRARVCLGWRPARDLDSSLRDLWHHARSRGAVPVATGTRERR